MRTLCVSLFVLALVLAPAIALSQTPQTYSLTMSMGGGMTIKVARDGSRESVEQFVPKSANGPGMHIRLLYDFATHKVWTVNLEGGPCTVVAYTSPEVPSMFDPITGSEEIQAGVAEFKPAVLRSETVNGFATKVYEVPVPEVNGKMRLFLEEKQKFAIKMVLIPGGGKEQTQMEVTALSFAKPAANLFVPPKDCQVLAGETNATGGHVETKIEASVQAEQKLGGGVQVAQKLEDGPQVEVRGSGVSPMNYTGLAPAAFQFVFSLEASAPIEVEWVLVSQADTAWASGKLVFDKPGQKDLVVPVKIGVSAGKHWEGAGHLEVVVGDKRVSSQPVKISADCAAK